MKISMLLLTIIMAGLTILSSFGWRLSRKDSIQPVKESYQLTASLKQHVYKLSQQIGDRSVFKYEKLTEAAEYIIAEFKSYGYRPEFQEYDISGVRVRNIIVTKTGYARPQEIIIIGAHYDTCFGPGADDNASGIAGLLELARLLSDKPINTTIKFIAFVNEEPPFFKTEQMGSRVYVKEARKKEQDLKGAIILEMISYYSDKSNSQRYPPLFGLFYPNKANFVAVVGNFKSGRLVKQIVRDFRKFSSFPIESVVTFGFIPGVDFSDHWSFWKEGYKAVMVTDTAFLRYPHYHSSLDTYEKLNYKNMAEVVAGLRTAILELANK